MLKFSFAGTVKRYHGRLRRPLERSKLMYTMKCKCAAFSLDLPYPPLRHINLALHSVDVLLYQTEHLILN